MRKYNCGNAYNHDASPLLLEGSSLVSLNDILQKKAQCSEKEFPATESLIIGKLYDGLVLKTDLIKISIWDAFN